MPTRKEPLTLYGGKADRFREIRDQLEDELGYRPSKPETIGILMSQWPPEDLDSLGF
jgi:hypothetical protein